MVGSPATQEGTPLSKKRDKVPLDVSARPQVTSLTPRAPATPEEPSREASLPKEGGGAKGTARVVEATPVALARPVGAEAAEVVLGTAPVEPREVVAVSESPPIGEGAAQEAPEESGVSAEAKASQGSEDVQRQAHLFGGGAPRLITRGLRCITYIKKGPSSFSSPPPRTPESQSEDEAPAASASST